MNAAYSLNNIQPPQKYDGYELYKPQHIMYTEKRDKHTKANDHKLKHIAVQPLVGEEIQRAKDYLLNRPERYDDHNFNLRDYTLFCFNINIGLRCGDLLNLKISDIMINDEIADSIAVKEQKTCKTKKPAREIFFKPQLKQLLKDYVDSLDGWEYDWYLFPVLWPRKNPHKPMGRHNLNHIMKDIEKGLELKVPLGTHSLRKTFARAIFDKLAARGDMMAIEKLKNILCHSSTDITRDYIGMQREENRDIYMDGDMI